MNSRKSDQTTSGYKYKQIFDSEKTGNCKKMSNKYKKTKTVPTRIIKAKGKDDTADPRLLVAQSKK